MDTAESTSSAPNGLAAALAKSPCAGSRVCNTTCAARIAAFALPCSACSRKSFATQMREAARLHGSAFIPLGSTTSTGSFPKYGWRLTRSAYPMGSTAKNRPSVEEASLGVGHATLWEEDPRGGLEPALVDALATAPGATAIVAGPAVAHGFNPFTAQARLT